MSLEYGEGILDYFVDGYKWDDEMQISGPCDWMTHEISLSAGVHSIHWRYRGYGNGWVDVSDIFAENGLKNIFPASYSSVRVVAINPNTRELRGDLFAGWSSLEAIRIPAGVTGFGRNTFMGCKSLEMVAVPTGLQTVGGGCFLGCESLRRVEVSCMEEWLGISFENAMANPLSRGAILCVGGNEVTELVIPEGTTEIGEYAFAGGQFTSVSMPNSVTNVAETAFVGCTNIAAVTVPSWVNVASIFADSKGKIACVAISAQGDVPASAYAGCSALKRVDVASMADWLSLGFANADANPLHAGAVLYVGGKEVKKLMIPEGTRRIGEYAFVDGQFTSVTIPNSVTNVAETAFVGCSNVVSVDVNGGLCCRFPLCDVFSEEWMPIGNGQYRSKTIGHNESTEMNVRVRLPNPTFQEKRENSSIA